MTTKRFYSHDDIEQAKTALNALPDLKPSRLSRADALEALKEHIIALCDDKGYTAEDIRTALETVGISAGVKAIRDILANRKKGKRRAPQAGNRAPVKSEGQRETPQVSGGRPAE